MHAANSALTLTGVFVVAPAEAGEAVSGEKRRLLGELHLRKIDLADRVLVVNPGGHISDANTREIAYARAAGKQASFTHHA